MVAIAGTGWKLAPSLRAMFDEADRRWPKRSKASDGSIGDLAHSKRTSDHNPDASGDVLAGDLTDDKPAGCDADLFAEHLRKSRDPRVKYVICNGKVFRSYGTNAWQWTPYTGINGHFSHTHVSVLDTTEAKNDTSPWFSYADAPDPAPRTLPTQSRGGAMYHPTDPNRADDFWVAADGSVRHAFYTGGKWTGEENLGGVIVSNFAAAWRGDGRQLRLVGVGTDGKRWERVYETTTGKWSAWRHVGGQ